MQHQEQPHTPSTATPTAKQRATELLAMRQRGLPEWIRSPKTGKQEHYTGLTRPTLYRLAGDGKIRSTSLREPGMAFGTRLFHLPSILAYIEAQAATGSHLNEQTNNN